MNKYLERMTRHDLCAALAGLLNNAFVYVAVASRGLVRAKGVSVCTGTDEDHPLPFLVIETDIKAPGI